MALRHVIRRGSGTVTSTVARQMARGGGGPPQPSIARIKPFDSPLAKNHDLIWSDHVAPETCIDFELPHRTKYEGLAIFLVGMGFFATLFQVARLSDPPSNNQAVNRTATTPEAAYDPSTLYDAVKESGGP